MLPNPNCLVFSADAKVKRRQPLPSCVMAACRDTYPSSDGSYVGFQFGKKGEKEKS